LGLVGCSRELETRQRALQGREISERGFGTLHGIEATREILRRHPGMPVVAMTGWEYEERALEVRQAGAVDYVSKSRVGPDLVEVLVAAARARRRAPER
jgi:DNA-binding NarL/FixJ family response regulator